MSTTEVHDPSDAQAAYLKELIAAGRVIATGVPGVYGRDRVFEDVLERFDQLISGLAKNDRAEWMRFPPVVNRKVFERSEFQKSFPQLTGTVFSFEGDTKKHQALLECIAHGQDWSHTQHMTDVVLTPAACYPVYPLFTGTLPEGGRTVDMASWCFRHEPSGDPARMQLFRVREFVRVGSSETVTAWRDLWLERGLHLLRGLGLDANPEAASDPFFGRGGKLLAVNQKEQRLKFEVLVPITSKEKPTAVVSFNWHQEHFGQLFDIKTSDGKIAQTACLGFGMERVVLALFKTHGLDPLHWPAQVRKQLWP